MSSAMLVTGVLLYLALGVRTGQRRRSPRRDASMSVGHSPHAPNIRALLAAARVDTCRGQYTCTLAPTPGGRPVDVAMEFTYRHPNRWELVSREGLKYSTDDNDGRWRTIDGRSRPELDAPRFRGDPEDPSFLLRSWDVGGVADDSDYHLTGAPPALTTVAGREAWHVTLAPPRNKTGELDLYVDTATGVCLAAVNRDLGLRAELSALAIDAEQDDSGRYVQ